MLAALTKVEEIELDPKEAEAIARGISDVSEFYDMPAAAPQTLAWFNLAQALGMVYGPRILAIRMRKASEKRKPAPVNLGGLP